MICITNHKGVNKIKVWYGIKNPSMLYNSLCANRNINENDLDIYSVSGTEKYLKNKKIFEFSNPSTLCIKETVCSLDDGEVQKNWYEIQPVVRNILDYTEQEFLDIATNEAEEDSANWISIPTKGVTEIVSSKSDVVVQTINVTKLNPFT